MCEGPLNAIFLGELMFARIVKLPYLLTMPNRIDHNI